MTTKQFALPLEGEKEKLEKRGVFATLGGKVSGIGCEDKKTEKGRPSSQNSAKGSGGRGGPCSGRPNKKKVRV